MNTDGCEHEAKRVNLPQVRCAHCFILLVCVFVSLWLCLMLCYFLAEQLAAIPEFAGLGPLFKSSSTAIDLTESETEYVVRCVKHVFKNHVVFQVSFECLSWSTYDSFQFSICMGCDIPKAKQQGRRGLRMNKCRIEHWNKQQNGMVLQARRSVCIKSNVTVNEQIFVSVQFSQITPKLFSQRQIFADSELPTNMHVHRTHVCGDMHVTTHMCGDMHVHRTHVCGDMHVHRTHVCGDMHVHRSHVCGDMHVHRSHVCGDMHVHRTHVCGDMHVHRSHVCGDMHVHRTHACGDMHVHRTHVCGDA